MSKTLQCPGCGLVLAVEDEQLDERYHASSACRQLYDELTAYTLSLRDPDFIHQLAIDTYTAQHAGPGIKPIGLAFALATLYLVFEHNYSGKKAQKAHMLIAKVEKARQWPIFRLPVAKASLTVIDVLNTPEQARDAMLRQWGEGVWRSWEPEHSKVAAFVHKYLTI